MNKVLTWLIRCSDNTRDPRQHYLGCGIFLAAQSFSAGFSRFSEIYGRMNPFNWIADLVLVLPDISGDNRVRRGPSDGGLGAILVIEWDFNESQV